MSASIISRLFVALIALGCDAILYTAPSPDQRLNLIAHLLFGMVMGFMVGSIAGEKVFQLWKKRHPKFCTSCGTTLKTYFLTAPDGKVHGSYRQCPHWAPAWNTDPVNCHNPPSKKRSSVGPWSSYFSAPVPMPPGAVCYVHGRHINLSCGSCLTYLQSRGVLDDEEVQHLLE